MKMWASIKSQKSGFTIVELLIVIVVIGILAAITIVAYNGVQSRARDTARTSDINNIKKALELYYLDNGEYPSSLACGTPPHAVNGAWCVTDDESWDVFESRLKTGGVGISRLPRDPVSTPGGTPLGGAWYDNYNYAYYAGTGDKCGSPSGQWYMLVYVLESGDQVNNDIDCSSGTAFNPYGGSSNVRVVR